MIIVRKRKDRGVYIHGESASHRVATHMTTQGAKETRKEGSTRESAQGIVRQVSRQTFSGVSARNRAGTLIPVPPRKGKNIVGEE